MRCRRRRTSSSTDAQLIEHQSRSSPSGPFATAVPWRPTCPSVLGSSVIVASTGPPDPRQHPFGSGHRPVSGQLCETAGGGASHVSRVPVAFRLPAFAFRVILCPLGDWAFLAVGLPGNARTPSGFHVSHARAATGLGALSTPGTAVLTRPTFAPRPPPAAFNGNVPAPRSNLHHPGLSITRHHRGFTCVHPSGLPLACSPRMERAPLSFSPELRTPPSPATHVRVGTGLEHWPEATPPASCHDADPPFCEPIRNVRPRVARKLWSPYRS